MAREKHPHIIPQLQRFAVSMKTLRPDKSNAREHDEENIDGIAASLKKFRQRIPIVVQKDGRVIRKGNGTYFAAKSLGWTHIAALIVDEDDIDATAFALVDNRTGDTSDWNATNLEKNLRYLQQHAGVELSELGFGGFDFSHYGIDEDELKRIDKQLQESKFLDEETDDEEEPLPDDDARGKMLELINVTIKEPVTKVAHGDVFYLGHHVLCCLHVHDEWSQWANKLAADENYVFAPYPGPFVPLVDKAKKTPFFMVQPDVYICGHIVDKYIMVHGLQNVEKA